MSTTRGRLLLALCLLLSVVTPPLSRNACLAEGLSPEDAALLDDLQRRTFRFFWETANPSNGFVPDRWPSKSPCSVAAVGFGLTALGVGVERDYVAREEAAERALATLRRFSDLDSSSLQAEHGFFYHFVDMQSGAREWECELSSIDTALLMMGVLFCREYFDGEEDREQEIRRLADALYRRVDWAWMRPHSALVCMGWKPESGFLRPEYQGYNEAMLLYLLAMGSPTHPVGGDAWEAFTKTYRWAPYHGEEHVNFSPLFGHQYSHVWVDFRGIRDDYMRGRGIDYFENSSRAVRSQRAYAINNPRGWIGYGPDCWGLTACDGPGLGEVDFRGERRTFRGYSARGASGLYVDDDGTIAPTAAGGSIPFAPRLCISALRSMRRTHGEALYGEYGFRDSFNPSVAQAGVESSLGSGKPGTGWVARDYLGIDQGPILLMAENHRTELVWEVMKRSPYLRAGLEKAGFRGGWLDGQP